MQRRTGIILALDVTERNRAIEIAGTVSFRGILYTTGSLDARGPGTFYGSVIARQAARVQDLQIYWDAAIVGDWPPDGLDVPKVFLTRWTIDP